MTDRAARGPKPQNLPKRVEPATEGPVQRAQRNSRSGRHDPPKEDALRWLLGGAQAVVQRDPIDTGYGDLVAAARTNPRAPSVQRKCARCDEEEAKLQHKPGAPTQGAMVEGADLFQTAAAGVRHASAPLPHLDQIQQAFGQHDVTHVRAAIGGAGDIAAASMGAKAYAFGDRVAFRSTPDLHLAAHEAAHVVQQQAGVQLKDGVGRAGDSYEQQADDVADAVVQGRSAEHLLPVHAPRASQHVQMACACEHNADEPKPTPMLQLALAAPVSHPTSIRTTIDIRPSVAVNREVASPAARAALPTSPSASGGEAADPQIDPALKARATAASALGCPEVPDAPAGSDSGGDKQDEDREECTEEVEDRTLDADRDSDHDKEAPPDPPPVETKTQVSSSSNSLDDSKTEKQQASGQGAKQQPPPSVGCEAGGGGGTGAAAKPSSARTTAPAPAAPRVAPEPPSEDNQLAETTLAAEGQRTGAIEAFELATNLTAETAKQLGGLAAAPPQLADSADGARDDRASANSLVATTFAGGATDAMNALTTLSSEIPAQLAGKLAMAKRAIDAATERQHVEIGAQLNRARAAAQRDARAALATIDSQYQQTVLNAVITTGSALAVLERSRTTTQQTIRGLQGSSLAVLDGFVALGQGALRGVGTSRGSAAIKIGNDRWAVYHRGRINRKDSFTKGHLTDRRAEARKKAARDVSVSFRDSFVNEAEHQAFQLGRSKAKTCAQIVGAGVMTGGVIDQQAGVFGKLILDALPAALHDAKQARDQLAASVNAQLHAQLATLSSQARDQRRSAQSSGYLQKLAVEQTAHVAATQLLTGAARAGQGVMSALVQARAMIEGKTAPTEQVGLAMAQLGHVLQQAVAMLRGQLQTGLVSADSTLDAQLERSTATLDRIGAVAATTAATMTEAFSTSVDQPRRAAITAFGAQSRGYTTQLTQLATSAGHALGCSVGGLAQTYASLLTGFVAGVKSQQESLEHAFDVQLGQRAPDKDAKQPVRTLPGEITYYACQAASHEQPAWKAVVKWILIIVILIVAVVVLGPLAGAAAGAIFGTAGTMAVIGTIVAGAVVGAITSAAIAMVNNWSTGQSLTKGVWQAALIGAVGGAFGAALGPLVQGAKTLGGFLVRQFVADIATEYVNQVAGNLISGKGMASFTDMHREGFLQAGLMSGPMALFGRAVHARAKVAEAAHTQATEAATVRTIEAGGTANESSVTHGTAPENARVAQETPRTGIARRAGNAVLDRLGAMHAGAERVGKALGSKAIGGLKPRTPEASSSQAAPAAEPAAPEPGTVHAAEPIHLGGADHKLKVVEGSDGPILIVCSWCTRVRSLIDRVSTAAKADPSLPESVVKRISELQTRIEQMESNIQQGKGAEDVNTMRELLQALAELDHLAPGHTEAATSGAPTPRRSSSGDRPPEDFASLADPDVAKRAQQLFQGHLDRLRSAREPLFEGRGETGKKNRHVLALELAKEAQARALHDANAEIHGPGKTLPPGASARTTPAAGDIPFGFRSPEAFQTFSKQVESEIHAADPDAQIVIEGSSVTGRRYQRLSAPHGPTGAPHDVGRISDLDVAIVSRKLFERLGPDLRAGGTPPRSKPLAAADAAEILKSPGLAESIRAAVIRATGIGRDVNFKIYPERPTGSQIDVTGE